MLFRSSDIILTMNSYTETSPSGDGYHILALGSLPSGGIKHSKDYKDEATGSLYKLEAYDSGRYFTVTGNTINSASINERTQQTAIVCEKYLSNKAKEQNQSTSVADSVLQKARHGENAARFIALFDRGDLSAYNGDHSAATMALVDRKSVV